MSAAIQIEAVLKSENRPMYLHEIREAIIDQFGAWHSESAISARIRDSVRPKLQAQGISLVGKAPKGKSAWQYSLVPAVKYNSEAADIVLYGYQSTYHGTIGQDKMSSLST